MILVNKSDIKKNELLKKSLATIKKLNEIIDNKESNDNKDEPIAVIGMACRFPGGSDTPEKFYSFIEKKRDGITEIPKSRWDNDKFYDKERGKINKTYVKEGGFLLEDIADFDAKFFSISPREAIDMDPQQRLLLEVVWEALERADLSADKVSNTNTGVYIGILGSEYSMLPRNPENLSPYTTSGCISNIASGRISYILNLKGPAMSIDTACSSSLVSVHMACESIRNGEIDMAIAGGVSLMVNPSGFVSLCQMNALSESGRCKTFDESADGYGRGEGCGVVILKSLSQAQKDNDNIIGLIRGSAINHDGTGSGLTVPNGKSQEAVIRKALENAHVEPKDIKYFEAHGTGTLLGDPIEMQAISNVFANKRGENNPLYIGSVKSNIGHLEAAAGISGLIKVLMSLYNNKILPNINLNNLNPRINLDKIPAIIPKSELDLGDKSKEQFAAISSFGFSGTNANMIVSNYIEDRKLYNKSVLPEVNCFTMSAQTKNSLNLICNKFISYLKNTDNNISDIAYSINTGRKHFKERVAFLGKDKQEMIDTIDKFIKNERDTNYYRTEKTAKTLALNINLIENKEIEIDDNIKENKIFKSAFNECMDKFGEHIKNNKNTEVIFKNFALEYGVISLLKKCNIKLSIVCAEGNGVYLAAYLCGIMSLDVACNYLLKNNGIDVDESILQSLALPKIQYIDLSKEVQVSKTDLLDPKYWLNIEKLNNNKVLDNIKFDFIINLLGNINITDTEKIIDLTCDGMSINVLLAKLYSMQIDINWESIYESSEYKKLILPTYQFDKKHYWIKKISFTNNQFNSEQFTDGLSGKIIKSPLKVKQIKYSINRENIKDLKYNEYILHVGHYIELIANAIKIVCKTDNFIIDELECLLALYIPDDSIKEIIILINENNSNNFNYEIRSDCGTEEWLLHVKGKVVLNEKNTLNNRINTEEIENYNNVITQNEFYNCLESKDVKIGTYNRLIDKVGYSDSDLIAVLKLTGNELNFYNNIDPATFDVCAQLFYCSVMNKNNRYMVSKFNKIICAKNNNLSGNMYVKIAFDIANNTEEYLHGSVMIFNNLKELVCIVSEVEMKLINENTVKLFETKDNEINSGNKSYLLELNDEEKEIKITETIIDNISKSLVMDKQDININESLFSMGLDSIVALEIKNNIENDLGINIPIDILLQGPSIKRLSQELLNKITKIKKPENVILDNNNSWINFRKKKDNCKMKLFCFPYGGAGASVYSKWSELFPDDIEICPIQYPGRENRLQDELIDNIDVLTDTLMNELQSEFDKPFAFYGHSAGSLVAYNLAYKLMKNSKKVPIKLFVSAYTSPSIVPNPIEDNFRKDLIKIGYKGIPNYKEVKDLSDEEYKRLFKVFDRTLLNSTEEQIPFEVEKVILPMGIADLSLVSTYKYNEDEKINIPIVAFHGEMDQFVSETDMKEWKSLTSNNFELNIFSGNHMFLEEKQNREELIKTIIEKL